MLPILLRMAIRGVIFDMDGVLCDSEPLICAAAQAMFHRRFAVAIAEHEFTPFVGSGEDRYLGGVAEARGLVLDMPADKDLTYDLYLELIRGCLQPLPGVGEFIAAARSAGLRLAVASAADRRKVEGNLREIGVPSTGFAAVITGSDVARKKPHPDGFLLAASRLGLSGKDCLVVEDAINGVKAAKAAGALCLGLTTSFAEDGLRAAGADWIAPHLGAVPSRLRAMLGV